MPKKPTPFALNDETTENSYGFTIVNDGIALEQFNDNPVMLNSHNNSTEHVIGKWNNVRVEGNTLLADAEFDTDDEDAKKIAGKVERGFLKAVSMGVGFFMEDMKYVAGKMVLLKCVLKEASIVAVPSNAKALRLYDLSTGKIFTNEVLALQLSGLQQNNQPEHKKISMKQILLSAMALVALGLTVQPENEAALDGFILKLKADMEVANAKALAAEQKVTSLEAKLTEQANLQTNAILDVAVTEGKITAQERAEFSALPLNVLTATLAKIPSKASLGALLTGGNPNATGEPKTFEELVALSNDAKDAFKAANPAKYKQLCEA